MGSKLIFWFGVLAVTGLGCAEPPAPPPGVGPIVPRSEPDVDSTPPLGADAGPTSAADAGDLQDGEPSQDRDATLPKDAQGLTDMAPEEFDQGPDADPVDVGVDLDAAPEPDPDAAPEPEPDPDAAPEPDPDAAPEPDPDAAPEPDPDAAVPVEGPVNDHCPDAIRVGAVGRQVLRGDTTNGDATQGRGPDVWYEFALPVATEVVLHLVGDEGWDTYLFVYQGDCGALDAVAQNDDEAPRLLSSRVERVLSAGRYRVAVAGFSLQRFGPFTLTANFTEAVPFNRARFGATHNSYSGEARRSVTAQLDQGTRLIEFDVHDDDYENRGDFRIGHGRPGDGVDHQRPNPPGDELGDWLETVADWSTANEDHAPITLVLDMKDNVANNHNFSQGNLSALNTQLDAVFGDRLFRAEEMPRRGAVWPTVSELRGRVLVVISGEEECRRGYRQDRGHRPAVAMNTRGEVVEVHDDGDDTLWYWQGRYDSATDAVRWTSHGRYDSGYDPAVAVDENGVVVEVHKAENRARLFYRVARVRADGNGIDWHDSHDYDNGVQPTVRFVGPGRIREVHQSQNNRQLWYREGLVNAAEGTIDWVDHARTDDPAPDESTDSAVYRGRNRTVSVSRRDGDDALHYRTAAQANLPIRLQQTAFVEGQQGDGWIDTEVHFFAAERGRDGDEFVANWMDLGGIVRLWNYNEANDDVIPHFPATDFPFAGWYTDHLEDIGGVAR